MDAAPRASLASSSERPQLSRSEFFGAMALGSLAIVLVVVRFPYLPTNDGPQHILSGYVESVFSQPGTPYSAVLEPLPAFAERGFSFVFVPLLDVFSWQIAVSITLAVIALSRAWAFAGLACALSGTRSPSALLGFVLAFPWTFYMGFFPFVLATNMGVGILAYAISRASPQRKHLLILSALLVVSATMHVGAAVTTGASLLILFVLRAPRGERLRAAGAAVLVGAPASVVMVGALVSASRFAGAPAPWVWTAARETLVEFPRYVLPGPLPRALAGCVLVVLGLFTGVRRVQRHEASRAELSVIVAALVFLVIAIASPLDLPGWQLVAPRFASLGTPLAVALLAPRAPMRSARVVLGAIGVLSGLSLAVTYDFHGRLVRGCEPALAGLTAPVSLAGFTLPLPLDSVCGVSPDPKISEVPHLAPLFHVGALYAVARGGFTPYMFGGSSAVHAFRYRRDALARTRRPPSPASQLYLALGGDQVRNDPEARDYLIARFAEYGFGHDHLLVVGAHDGELAGILARGYEADWREGFAMIAHARPCPLDVVVEVEQGGASGARVEIGQRPAANAMFAMTAAQGVELARGVRRLRFSGGGCGPVWVRGYLDVDGSGDASKGDLYCAGAGRDGNLNVDLVTPVDLHCRLVRRETG